MDEAKTQLLDKLKSANNVLVTVSRNPSVDQLAALLGFTLFLNKQGKHAAAVFSGNVPSTLEFLKPEETIEKTTDSLRDFIIALDKNKADKLRYKVEDDVVRIFITPYKTSITEDDFEFSQGDFNVDLVIAIGVTKQEDLDEAITAHGRILHDAVVASINVASDSQLGTINWHVPSASSLSELATELAQAIDTKSLDQQIATALLTGIVAETDRFSNEKTSSAVMSASAALMSAGANQQLVVSKLQEGGNAISLQDGGGGNDTNDGAIDISHGAKTPASQPIQDNQPFELPEPSIDELPSENTLPSVDSLPSEQFEQPEPALNESGLSGGSKLVTEPPTLGGELSANTHEEGLNGSTDPISAAAHPTPMLEHNSGNATASPPASEPLTPPGPPTPSPIPAPEPLLVGPVPEIASQLTPPPPAWVPPEQPLEPEPIKSPDQTLIEIEEAVNSPHIGPLESVDDARDEVSKALNSAPSEQIIKPSADLNAQPLGIELRPSDLPSEPTTPSTAPPMPPEPSEPQINDRDTPPPVPPPLPPSGLPPAPNPPV